MRSALIIYGEIPEKGKVETYCLNKGGRLFRDKKEILELKRKGYKLIFKKESDLK